MSAIGQIKASTLIVSTGTAFTNSATVGVDKTFDPERILPGGVVKWVDRSGGQALGFPAFTMAVRPPSKDSRVYKVSAKVFLPVLETIDPAVGIFGPKLAYTLQCHMDWLLPERSTLTERKALASLVRSLMFFNIQASDGSPTDNTGSPLSAAIENFEEAY